MLNYENLVSKGRAKAYGQPWTPEELEFLIILEKERGLARVSAADYIRNGIKSLEDYDKAKENDFKPLGLEEAKEEANKVIETRGKEAVKGKSKSKK